MQDGRYLNTLEEKHNVYKSAPITDSLSDPQSCHRRPKGVGGIGIQMLGGSTIANLNGYPVTT